VKSCLQQTQNDSLELLFSVKSIRIYFNATVKNYSILFIYIYIELETLENLSHHWHLICHVLCALEKEQNKGALLEFHFHLTYNRFFSKKRPLT